MKKFHPSSQRGSAFITVMMFCTILLLLIASVLKYSTFERRLNNRTKLVMEARAGGEAISEYGIAQVKNILEANRSFTDSVWSTTDEALFTSGPFSGTAITRVPDSFWTGGHIADNTYSNTNERPLMNIGKILDISAGGLYYVDPTNPDNDNDPLKGKRVFRYDLDILSRATAIDSFGGGNVTKYMKQSFSIRAVPLFANAVYYNMDLELWPQPTMTITGSTHTNGRLFVRSVGSNPITFAGPVTAVKGFWTRAIGTPALPYLVATVNNGSPTTITGSGTVSILKAGTTSLVPMQLAAATTGYSPNLPTGTWVESTWELAPSGETWQQHIGEGTTPTETALTKEDYGNWTRQTIKGNLLTHVNGLLPVNLQGIPDYVYTYGSLYPDPLYGLTSTTGPADTAYTYLTTGNDVPNSAHGLIEPPLPTTSNSYVKAVEDIKYSRNAGLYIVANTTGSIANGHKPDGTVIKVAPYQYRCFMNDTSTAGTQVVTEVILPGQKTYGDSTGAGAPYIDATTNPTHAAHAAAMPIVQMVNINYTTGVEDRNSTTGLPNTPPVYPAMNSMRSMTDMRRTEGGDPSNDTTTTFSHSTARSATNKYAPKKVFMIDIDMMELKKAVKTITVATGTSVTTTGLEFFATGLPTAGNYANHIYHPTPTGINVTLNDTTRIIKMDTTLTTAFSTTTWNGAVYVESVAAAAFDSAGTTAAIRKAKTHEKHNSGVRLINGRGKVPSLATTPGFTLATNDAAYIFGSFNSDGLASTPASADVAVNLPAVPGDSTGHNPDDFSTTVPVSLSTELPASLVADAVTLLSQPNLNTSTSQNGGWNDALSGNTYDATSGSYSTSWQTTAPSGSNSFDGDNTAIAPFQVAYDSSNGSWSTTRTTKLPPVFSEYSVALLTGLVPTGKNGVSQNSGGFHNFPRFLEDWSVDCRIRGAFVALFESRVATEPWSLRVYQPPNRIWGFNLVFNTGKMPPLTPKTIHFRRSSANDISKADYNALLTAWGVTPLIP